MAVAAIGFALWFWMPAASVDITLRQASVSTEIVYSVVVPGGQAPSDAAFTVEASEQSAEVPFTIEIPASGTEREPDGTASGTLLFRNVGDAPVTLEQGTELSTAAGTSYMLMEPVEVPAGSLEEPGEAEESLFDRVQRFAGAGLRAEEFPVRSALQAKQAANLEARSAERQAAAREIRERR